jgi:hypothetical protein
VLSVAFEFNVTIFPPFFGSLPMNSLLFLMSYHPLSVDAFNFTKLVTNLVEVTNLTDVNDIYYQPVKFNACCHITFLLESINT